MNFYTFSIVSITQQSLFNTINIFKRFYNLYLLILYHFHSRQSIFYGFTIPLAFYNIFFNNEQYDPYHYQHRSKYLTDTDHHIRKESFRQHPDHIISLRIEYP